MVQLLNNGKPRSEMIREYELTASSFDKWVRRINATGSTHDKDNRTPEEQEMLGEHRGTYLFVFCELTACLTSAMLVPVRRTIWLSEAPALRIR